MAWERAEGCAGKGRAGRRGAGCQGALGKTKIKGKEAFLKKTCKKQLVLCCTRRSPIQLPAERCWVRAQTSTLPLSKLNSYGLIFFSISSCFSLVFPLCVFPLPCTRLYTELHPSGYLPLPGLLIPLTFLGIISIPTGR